MFFGERPQPDMKKVRRELTQKAIWMGSFVAVVRILPFVFRKVAERLE